MKISLIIKNTFAILIGLYTTLQIIYWTPQSPKLAASDVSTHLQQHWTNLKAKNLVHGTILIEQNNKIIFSDGNLDELYPIGSISKSFVGYMIFEMQKNGFSADQSICTWLKNFCKDNLERITVKQLLQHTSGFGRDVSPIEFAKRTFQEWKLSDIDQIEMSKENLQAEPGTKMIYSNFGFLVLSRILEIIHQKDFSVLVSDLTHKEGLNNIFSHNSKDKISRELLIPFVPGAHLTVTTKSSLHELAGAGGILSSAHDMLAWLNILDRAKFNQDVFTTQDARYSHGWMRPRKQSFEAYWHNGATLGTYSLIAYIPEKNLKIVLLTNNYKPAKQWSLLFDQLEYYLY